MTTRYFKAMLEAIPPSHSTGKRMVVWGTAFDGQVAREQAVHIGYMQGLGKSKVVKITFYKTGHGWSRSIRPVMDGSMRTTRRSIGSGKMGCHYTLGGNNNARMEKS